MRHSKLLATMDAALTRHAFSCFLHLLSLSSLSACMCSEAFIFLNDWDPTYQLLPFSLVLFFLSIQWLLLSRPNQVYLVDFSCFKPPTRLRVTTAGFMEHLSVVDIFDKESQAFMGKVLSSSGQGEKTYLPDSLHYIPPKPSNEDSIEEAHMLLFSVFDDLLSKTGLSPSEIDLLIVNCSGFCPAPSLSSIVVNRYAMREDVKTFSLSGMGCSASAVGVDIASGYLKRNPNSYAVILSTEILSTGWYAGRERNKLLINCTFRTGSAAVLLTNRGDARRRAKYSLNCVVRTHRAFEDGGYRSGIREEDAEGITGFTVSRDLFAFVGKTLRANAVQMGMIVLPLSEKLKHMLWYLRRMFIKAPSDQIYVPNFRKVIQHYCIPPVGVAYIKEVGRRLRLKPVDVEPALMTFHRFANQSSSSMWYQMAYMEAKGRINKGDRVWQVAIGSGPKCNSVVWKCLRNSVGLEEKGPWSDCIASYPIGDDDSKSY